MSALQQFAVCPYKFFLSAICRLEPRQEIASLEHLDPLTRGAIFIACKPTFCASSSVRASFPSADRLGSAIAILDATLERVADEYREQLAPAIRRVWQNDIEALRVDLRMWLERSVETQATWEPIAFELAFGIPGEPRFDQRSIPGEVVLDGGFRLRGIVDLVERKRGAPDLRVTDHKTGANHTKPNLVVGGGETLQPILYGPAVERTLGERVAETRLFYCTRAGQFEERVVQMTGAARRRSAPPGPDGVR